MGAYRAGILLLFIMKFRAGRCGSLEISERETYLLASIAVIIGFIN